MDPFFIESLGKLTDIATGQTWDSDKLRREILKRTHFYSEKGIGLNDNVVILHNNNNNFFADLFSLWMVGACVSCLDKEIGKDEFEKLSNDLKLKFAVINDRISKRLDNSFENVTVLNTKDADGWEPKLVFVKKPLDSPALILYTSGSTGLPKGVVHSLRTLQTKWFVLRNHVPLDVCENTLCLLPTHFGHGLICNALYPLVHGKHVVLLPKSDLKNLTNLSTIIDQYEITFMSSVAATWRIVLRVCPPPKKKTLRQVHIGSAPLGADLWRAVQKWTNTLKVWNTYGITETGSWMAGPSINEDMEPIDGLIGYGWGTDIMITSVNDMPTISKYKKFSLPNGEKGYVWLRTPCVMHGYLNEVSQTENVLQGSWFYTGDIGMIDEKGRLVLTGRERNEINKGGMKVSPEEIDVIIERHPAIVEACAFAIEDKILGQNIGICVVFNNAPPPRLSDLMSWCKETLSDYKIPARWYSVENIPKTSRGKIKRDKVSEYCSTLECI